ncbi:MAG TPA: PfkB family carbohydrate kinase [Candidatus Cloacimonadota bacterium]|nr:PfkB family carbohydrate kinase [Candidatus Cloacimonadota bacterium]HPT70664.1 PfkB family carbohydrate kinase [Candidatus Cloacimonadota bacterium]
MSLVVVGSIALDTISTPAGSITEALGGSAVYASLAARHFCKTHIVGVVGEDFPVQSMQMLSNKGINTDGIEVRMGKTFRWKGEYQQWNQALTHDTQLNVFADFDPQLPSECKACEFLLLGNIHPELQLNVLSQIGSHRLSSCDTMNYWIDRAYIQLLEVIRKVDIVFINEDELRLLTKIENVYSAAQQVLELGPQLVIVKRGEYGSVAVGRNFLFFAPVYPVKNMVDPTGAGDSFAGGFMGYLAQVGRFDDQSIREATIYGTIMASYNVSSFSTDVLESVSKKDIETRKSEIRNWVIF